MRVVNISEGPIFLDDIGCLLSFDRAYTPHEIPDSKAKKSHALRYVIASNMAVDVTSGEVTTEELGQAHEKYKQRMAEMMSRPSKYEQQQAVLARVDHSQHSGQEPPHAQPRRPARDGRSAKKEFAETGKLSLAWTGPACFPPGTRVTTPQGDIAIEDIRPGDLVFTHMGRVRKVVRRYERHYAGDMVKIRTSIDNREIILTPYHKVVATKGAPCCLGNRRTQACKPSCKTQYNKVKRPYGKGWYYSCVQRPYQYYKLEKIPAGDLTANDFVFRPRLRSEEVLKAIKISDYINGSNFSEANGYIWPSITPGRTSKSTIARKAGVSINWIYEMERLSDGNRTMLEMAISEADSKPPEYDPVISGNRILNEQALDYDFGWLLGIYVAEGSKGTNVSTFGLHANETRIHNKIRQIAKDKIGLDATIKMDGRPGVNGATVTLSSSLLARFLYEVCGRDCYNKRIPPFMFSAPAEAVTGFIHGYWAGDGTKSARKKDNSIKFGTTSSSLANGICLLLSRFGIAVCMNVEKRGITTIRGKVCKGAPCYVGVISGRQLYENEWLLKFEYNKRPCKMRHARERQHYVDDDGCHLRIICTSLHKYDGLVYDLEVEDDHTYLVDGKGFSNSDHGGYARMNRRFMFGLADAGADVKHEMLDSMRDVTGETAKRLNQLTTTRIPDDAIKVYGMTAPLIYDWSRYKMLFTMMETRRLHKDYVERANCADEILVPTRWCKEVFEESGVKKPISVVPLGVDTSLYKPGLDPLGFSKPVKEFVFLSVFGWSLRKGYDVLLKAYMEEFTSKDPVTLVIASKFFGSTDESKKQVIRDDIKRVSSQVRNPDKPQLILFGDNLSDEMMPRLYAAADCYVLISRGEGFSLPVVEAGACQLPVITSRYSGHTDFVDDENSYLVDVDGFQSAEKSLAWISYFYENAEFPIFGPPAIEQTRHHMRRVFENREEATGKAKKLYDRVTKDYTWDVAVASMHEKLKQTYRML